MGETTTSDQPTIFTIGHSTREWMDFIELLTDHQIDLVADIRSYPSSRHYPQYNRETMEEALAVVSIGYVHLPALGGRRKPQPDSPNTTWRHPSFRGYADYMETPAFAAGIDRLTALARQHRTAYMCSEAVWWKCHRRMVSDYLTAHGWQVWHIQDQGLSRHTLSDPARLVDGELTYHPMQTQGVLELHNNE